MKYVTWMTIVLLSGCQLMPKEPKKPDTSPKVPINKTIPPEIQDECRPQESVYENPTH